MIALFPHCGFLSETSRMLAIAQALRARGHSVVLATHGGPFTRVLDDAGERYTLLKPTVDAAQCRAFIDAIVHMGQPGRQLQSADEVRASVREEAAFLTACGADMAVIGFSLTLYLSSRLAGIPLATSHGGSFVPPVFERGLMPTPVQSPAPMLDWLPDIVLRWMANAGPARMRQPAAFLNVVADEIGVERVPSLAAMMLGDLTLVTDVPEVLGISKMEMEQWSPHGKSAYRVSTQLRYVGPMYARLSVAIPAHVRAFMDGTQPTAYVALNSTTPSFIRRVVAGIRGAGLRVIVAATVHELGDLADDNTIVCDILPSHEVMPQVDLAVIMGGQGSVQTAMCAGTPFIAFPLHLEQDLNVALAVRLGMAIGMSTRRMTEASVRATARQIIQQSSFRTAARRVQALYANTDGAARSADVIIEYLASRKREKK